MVDHILPKTLSEALEAIQNGDRQVIAGGTDWMVQARNWAGTLPKATKPLVFLSQVDELVFIRETAESIEIGAMTPMDAIMTSELVPSILRETIAEIAAPGIRHLATLGGNIANASPAADAVCTLIALQATVSIRSSQSSRILPLTTLITGPKRTCLLPNELITTISIPKESYSRQQFQKIGGRKADAISKVSLAAVATMHGDIVTTFRLAFGAVGPTVVSKPELDATFLGRSVSEIKMNATNLIDLYASVIRPIDDQRSTADYRKQVALNLIRRFIDSF